MIQTECQTQGGSQAARRAFRIHTPTQELYNIGRSSSLGVRYSAPEPSYKPMMNECNSDYIYMCV